MTSFKTGDRQVIEAFAAQFGLPASAAPDGSFSFVFAESGTLTLTAADRGERVVLSLGRHLSRVDPATLRRALSVSGVTAEGQPLLQCGLTSDDELVLAVGIESEDLSLPMLGSCLQTLLTQHRALL